MLNNILFNICFIINQIELLVYNIMCKTISLNDANLLIKMNCSHHENSCYVFDITKTAYFFIITYNNCCKCIVKKLHILLFGI